ncbi:hypothetical protein BN946_scf184828.g17 [Trametes cinnabarina]|uniref:Uncharacterized protein n=1 Tax=Pycnoporus cinnabarinus TaxID=5643 RepID=A0A060SJJ3_PYCCI|nr:hypothetical protein BN946_scf184828.g17 [Trametes cinnabarina]
MYGNTTYPRFERSSTSPSYADLEHEGPAEFSEATVHGPALPDDDPQQLYDNWAGELAECAGTHADDGSGGYTESESDGYESQVGEELEEEWVAPGPERHAGTAEAQTESASDGQWGSSPARTEYDRVSSPAQAYDNDEGNGEEEAYAPDVVNVDDDEDMWWPWPSREACLLDMTGAFPRSLFSESEMNAVRWYALKNGVQRLPTIRQVKLSREQVLNVAGAEPRTHEGMCGHLYTTNNLVELIKHLQEFANPVTRVRLHLYSEDGDGKLEEARQGRRWHEEIDPVLAGPMARSEVGKDYYVNEMALAKLRAEEPATPVMIARWFMRAGLLVAKVYPLRMTPDRRQFVVDARPSAVKDGATLLGRVPPEGRGRTSGSPKGFRGGYRNIRGTSSGDFGEAIGNALSDLV